MADRKGTIEWRLSTHNVLRARLDSPINWAVAWDAAPTKHRSPPHAPRSGDAECFADSPRL